MFQKGGGGGGGGGYPNQGAPWGSGFDLLIRHTVIILEQMSK